MLICLPSVTKKALFDLQVQETLLNLQKSFILWFFFFKSEPTILMNILFSHSIMFCIFFSPQPLYLIIFCFLSVLVRCFKKLCSLPTLLSLPSTQALNPPSSGLKIYAPCCSTLSAVIPRILQDFASSLPCSELSNPATGISFKNKKQSQCCYLFPPVSLLFFHCYDKIMKLSSDDFICFISTVPLLTLNPSMV